MLANRRLAAQVLHMSYTQILYPQLRDLLDDSAQLIEVLPPAEYNDLHLPGALSIPLMTLDAGSTAQLDRTKAVAVYCWDGL
jgi:rhodanese-related sulfurtransferase